MAYTDADAEILKMVAAHLFEESKRIFREAHLKGMDSLNDSTSPKQLERLGAAIRDERLAITMQEEAIELQRRLIGKRTEQLSRLRAAIDKGSPPNKEPE